MEGGLAGSAGPFEAKSKEPVTGIITPPISDGGLTCATAHHSDAAKQEYRQQVISLTFGLSEIGEK
jgi:hypothetical protein